MISLRNRIYQLGFCFGVVLDDSFGLVACVAHVDGLFAGQLRIVGILVGDDGDAFKFMEVGFFEVGPVVFFFGSSGGEGGALFEFAVFVGFDGSC